VGICVIGVKGRKRYMLNVVNAHLDAGTTKAEIRRQRDVHARSAPDRPGIDLHKHTVEPKLVVRETTCAAPHRLARREQEQGFPTPGTTTCATRCRQASAWLLQRPVNSVRMTDALSGRVIYEYT